MTLTALLSAQMPSSDGAGDGLSALLPLAGLTVIERQAQDAAAIGAEQLLVLVDAVPPSLIAALDRIRSRGLSVTIVRDGAAVMAAADDKVSRVLLVADGLIAPRALWQALAGASVPRLLAVNDTPATAALERIDVHRRWAGLATVDMAAVAALTDLPSDWDPQLALLRGAVQAEVPSISCEPQLFERGDIAVLDRALAADLVEQRLLASGTDAVVGLFHAHIALPLARAGARMLLQGQFSGMVARVLTALCAAAAILAMVLGYPMVAMFEAICGLLARAAGEIVAAFRPESASQRLIDAAGTLLYAMALLAAAWAVSVQDQGHGLLWASVALTIVLISLLGRLLAVRQVAEPVLIWDDGATWVALSIGAMAGAWPIALTAIAPLAGAILLFALWKRRDRKAV